MRLLTQTSDSRLQSELLGWEDIWEDPDGEIRGDQRTIYL
jgi:hypothetical protein